MRKSTVILIILTVLALIGGIVFSILQSRDRAANFIRSSDAPRIKGTITVAGDNYLGYWFITSPEFLRNLRQKGYALNWVNDGGDYAARHKQFNDSKYDLMVLPVNSYLYHGKDYNYPGVIVSVISDSKGADSILAYSQKVGGTKVNDLDNPNLKIGFTADSPSSFLLNTAIVHFDLKNLKTQKVWRQETKSSKEAYELLRAQKIDAAVLWEPDVSLALALPGIVPIFGSDQVAGMIVDVFVAQRELVLKEPEKVSAFFQAYFETLTYYDKNRDEMFREMGKIKDAENKIIFKSRDESEKAVNRIAWFDYEDNYRWFGLTPSGIVATTKREKLIDTISQVSQVMLEIGDFKTDPLRNNPYTIVNSTIIASLYGKVQNSSAIGAVMPISIAFAPLTISEWQQLKAMGTMRILPILFQSGTTTLTIDGRKVVDEAAIALSQNYPQYRILIKGHTAPSGDEQANITLSQERADSVKRYLEAVHGFDASRIMTIGLGSREPLSRLSGEGELSYRTRLARVEFVLLEDKR
ncbi:MAG: OmpA family protein [Candidatus Nealsonbacteria bacterium]|nr:OmpA family protein [Candidatus Nealsonbacteria bacterium]